MLMAGSFAALLEAIDIYTHEAVHRVTSGMLALTDREKVILGLYYQGTGGRRWRTSGRVRQGRDRRAARGGSPSVDINGRPRRTGRKRHGLTGDHFGRKQNE